MYRYVSLASLRIVMVLMAELFLLFSHCRLVASQQGPPPAMSTKQAGSPAATKGRTPPPGPSSARGAKPSPQTIAQEMVHALRVNDHLPYGPAGSVEFVKALATDVSEQEEQVMRRCFDKARAVMDLPLADRTALSVHAAIRALYASRKAALRPEQVPEMLTTYETRCDKLVAAGRGLSYSGGELPKNFTPEYIDQTVALAVLATVAPVFYEFLWDGGAWKAGNPERATARQKSILKSKAASKWEEAASRGKTLDRAFVLWPLLAVDALFVDDAFQESVFDQALPFAVAELER